MVAGYVDRCQRYQTAGKSNLGTWIRSQREIGYVRIGKRCEDHPIDERTREKRRVFFIGDIEGVKRKCDRRISVGISGVSCHLGR